MNWKDKEDLKKYFRNYMQNYIKTSHGSEIKRKAKLKYRLAGKEKKQIESYRKNNPQIRKAHTLVERLLKKGLKKPDMCMSCGKIGDVLAHHPDYKLPNIFTWICRLCHANQHRKAG